MAKSKKGNPQPQSGASSEERKSFSLLPKGKKNKKSAGQDTKSLAPLLHWDVDDSSDNASDSDGDN
jgi:hypothetical protein